MVRKVRYEDDYILIENRDGEYFPYIDRVSLMLGRVSPSISRIYSQNALKQAYETGILKSAFK